MSKCEALCGKDTKVAGCPYCPECYPVYTHSRFLIHFIGADRDPVYTQNWSPTEDYLLINKCDGFHLAYANFDDEDGEFLGFFEWSGSQFQKEFYVAWAKLPDHFSKQMQHFLEGIGVK